MTTLHGKHLIGGAWFAGTDHFTSTPVHGHGHNVSEGDTETVQKACQLAEAAFWDYAQTSAEDRANFLNAIADEIEARAADITSIGCAETGLPEARLEGERGRTTGQLRLFANHIMDGTYLDYRHDPALPDRTPLPRPDLKLVQRPVGPVAIFGASNFPLAFSTAGGDTASALAAGCPVVVKGHPAHPGTSEIVADAILWAILKTGMPTGVFALVQSSGIEAGTALVQHPLISAVGFTGSLRAGRALFDLCAARPTPIPFYGELGAINPVFALPEAMAERGSSIAQGWAASLTMGVGQFCTNPGVLIAVESDPLESFAQEVKTALSGVAAQDMLTPAIAQACKTGRDLHNAQAGVKPVLTQDSGPGQGSPSLSRVTGQDWLASETLAEEVFGPHGLLVTVSNANEMLELARHLDGQLTATLQMNADDAALAKRLLPILERKAGRILANGFPTGVEVADAMVHGGPYPASTNFGATSVGTMAIRRFLRPVCYQSMPDELLPILT